MEILESEGDRKLYQSELDEKGINGEPHPFNHIWPDSIEYPCIVRSVFVNNELGGLEYVHSAFTIEHAYSLIDLHERLNEHGDS